MPKKILGKKVDEKAWEKAKSAAEEEGQGGNYGYIMTVYKRMEGLKSISDEQLDLLKTKTRMEGTKRVYAEGKSQGKEVGTVRGAGGSEDPKKEKGAKKPDEKKTTGADNPNDKLKTETDNSVKGKTKEIVDMLSTEGIDVKDPAVTDSIIDAMKEKIDGIDPKEIAEAVKELTKDKTSGSPGEISQASISNIVTSVVDAVTDKIKDLFINPERAAMTTPGQVGSLAATAGKSDKEKKEAMKERMKQKRETTKKDETKLSLKSFREDSGHIAYYKMIPYIEKNSDKFSKSIVTRAKFLKLLGPNLPEQEKSKFFREVRQYIGSIQKSKRKEGDSIKEDLRKSFKALI